jgi:hypothetical protein
MLTMSPSGSQPDEELRLYPQEFHIPFPKSQFQSRSQACLPVLNPDAIPRLARGSRSHGIFEEDEVVI